MSDSWDEFSREAKQENQAKISSKGEEEQNSREDAGCDWGQNGQHDEAGGDLIDTNSARFIPIYEKYQQDKQAWLKQHTANWKAFQADPQKNLSDWFENEGHEFDYKLDKLNETQYICQIELPMDDQDFLIASELNIDKRAAIQECCLLACKLLDECDLLYSWQQGGRNEEVNLKKKFDDANKEDDIELDNTSKRLRNTSDSGSTTDKSQVNTYESLMARWTELNMSILQSKAKLVRLDLSVNKDKSKTGTDEKGEDDDDDEVDPLDEFMSNLESKTKLSLDDKIEKSRLKSRIRALEREQEETSRLIELAKPRFDLNKACPTNVGRNR